MSGPEKLARAFLAATTLVLLAVSPVGAQNRPSGQLPSVSLPPALDRVLRDYEAAWSERDASALANLFAPDGFVMARSRPPVRGRNAIRQYYTGHGGPLYLRAFAWAAEDSVGYILGGYASAKGQPDDGKFTLTLKKDTAGRWLIMSDMDNGNR